MQKQKQNLKLQILVTVIAILLFAIKIIAWWLTQSVAILSDALESIVNVVAGIIGVYSLYIASKPKDADHPYGHGKAEFISAAVEGTLITVAGLLIIYESINNLLHPHKLQKVDSGIILVAVTAAINFFAGWLCIRTGTKNNSLALVASGKHLQSDTWTTLGIVISLVLIYFFKYPWIDSVVAILLALFIIFTGYKILRGSIAGIMDEADEALLQKLVATLNENRTENWIDLHNLRIIKYGSTLHLDCHLTVPWYLNVHEAHREIDALSALVKKGFGESVELFVHSDGCLDFSCKICSKQQCPVRKFSYEKALPWTMENISSNQKHQLSK